VLNAWGNQLTALPDAFGCLAGLTRLGLKGNQLAALPGSFVGLTNLVELFLTDNKLTTLPQGARAQQAASASIPTRPYQTPPGFERETSSCKQVCVCLCCCMQSLAA
jgi:Leucine-rich repeat (LRR) protein